MTITSEDLREFAERFDHADCYGGKTWLSLEKGLSLLAHIDAQAARIAELDAQLEKEGDFLIDAMEKNREQQAVIDQRNGECDRLIKELAALRGWVKCVEAERDKAIGWHSSLLRKYEQLIQPAPIAVLDDDTLREMILAWNRAPSPIEAYPAMREVLRLNSGSKPE